MAAKEDNGAALTPFSAAHSVDVLTSLSHEQDYFSTRPQRLALADAGTVKAPSPFDRIPSEIISQILEAGYSSGFYPDDDFRQVVSLVSTRLRQITLSTPSLWSTYHITPGNVSKYLPHLHNYLQLSRAHPLDINLTCMWPPETTKPLMDILTSHSERWRRLTITSSKDPNIFDFLVDVQAPRLEFVSIAHFSPAGQLLLGPPIFGGQLPKLDQLALRNVSLDNVGVPLSNLTKLDIRGHGSWPEPTSLEEALGGGASLQELILHVKPRSVLLDLNQGPNLHPISLPALRKFTVITSEWLTDDVARLVRAFAVPNIEELVVQEGFGNATFDSTDILRYSTSPEPTLVAAHCNLSVACQCLTPEQLGTLRNFEICKAERSDSASLSLAFRAMHSLERMVFTKCYPYDLLRGLGLAASHSDANSDDPDPLPEINDPTEILFTIPSLSTLFVELGSDSQPMEREMAHFFRLFSLPSLSSLYLRRFNQVAWEQTLGWFAQHPDDYSKLDALTVADMHALQPSASASPVCSFPRLRRLTIIRAPSSLFLSHLAQIQGDGGNGGPWADLNSIVIYADTHRSRPLLHRVIERGEEVGRPIERLHLDGSFKSNEESWDWILEKVPRTVEIPPGSF